MHTKLLRNQLIGTGIIAVMVMLLILFLHYKRRWFPQTVTIPENIPIDTIEATKPQLPALRLHVFDPNTVDSVELLELGFTPPQTRAFLNYRRKGKRWYQKDQLRSLYGMTDSAYNVLEPYIAIDTMPFYLEREKRRQERLQQKQQRDSLNAQDSTRTFVKRIKKDTILELNSADTTALMWIAGIGPVRAQAIVQRREALGGYVEVEQLVELMQLYPYRLKGLDTVLHHFTISKDSIRTLSVNTLSVRELSQHPYISASLAKEIITYRQRYGTIQNEAELRRLKSLRHLNDSAEKQLQRLLPYLSFE